MKLFHRSTVFSLTLGLLSYSQSHAGEELLDQTQPTAETLFQTQKSLSLISLKEDSQQEKEYHLYPLMEHLTYKEGQPYTLLKIIQTWKTDDQTISQQETEQEILLHSTPVGWQHYEKGYSHPKVTYSFTFDDQNVSIPGEFVDKSRKYLHQKTSHLNWVHDDQAKVSWSLSASFFLEQTPQSPQSHFVRFFLSPLPYKEVFQTRFLDEGSRTYAHPDWIIPEYQHSLWQRPHDNTQYEEKVLLRQHRIYSGVITEHTEERLTSANNSECLGRKKNPKKPFHSPTFFYKVYNYYTTYKWDVTTFGNGTQVNSQETAVNTRKVEVGNFCTR